MRSTFLTIFPLISAITAAPSFARGKAADAAQQQSASGPVSFTIDQVSNLYGATEILIETFFSNSIFTDSPDDPNKNVQQGVLTLHQQVINGGLFQQHCNFTNAGILFSDNSDDNAVSGMVVEDILLLASLSLLNNVDGLNLNASQLNQISDIFSTASVLAEMIAASDNFKIDLTNTFVDISMSDLVQFIKIFQPVCAEDIGLNNSPLSDIGVFADLPAPFITSSTVPFTFNASSQCPPGDNCVCQVFTGDLSVPIKVSPPDNCATTAGSGMNLLYMTKDSTPLSRNATERAAQIGSIVVGPALMLGN